MVLIAKLLKNRLEEKGITVYRLSKLTGIRYELLRRTLNGERKLTADELILICQKSGIVIDELK